MKSKKITWILVTLGIILLLLIVKAGIFLKNPLAKNNPSMTSTTMQTKKNPWEGTWTRLGSTYKSYSKVTLFGANTKEFSFTADSAIDNDSFTFGDDAPDGSAERATIISDNSAELTVATEHGETCKISFLLHDNLMTINQSDYCAEYTTFEHNSVDYEGYPFTGDYRLNQVK